MISILIVNWNGNRYIADCLRSIAEKVSGPYEVIVVDNNSTDGSPELVADGFPEVRLIRSLDNLGFAKGNNLAARHASGDVLFLLNYDTLLLADPTPFAQVLLDDATIGCIGANMCNGEGVVVANCGHFPSPFRLLLFSSLFWKPYKGRCGPSSLHARRVDWVEGSWVLLRRETWERIGGFDPEIFMYGEDVDLSKRITDAGLKVIHLPIVAYRHYTGWSVHRLPYQYAGFLSYHRKHSKAFQRYLAEGVLFFGLQVRLCAYWALEVLTHNKRFEDKVKALRHVKRLWTRLIEPGFIQD